MKPPFKKILIYLAVLVSILLVSQKAQALTVDPKGKVEVSKIGQVLSRGSSNGEDDSEEGTLIKTEAKDGEVRTETRFPSGVRVKTREEEGKQRVDIYEGGQKLRLERREDRTIVKLENEKGEEVELPEGSEEEVFKIEERAGKEEIRVRASGEKFLVERGKVGAQTKFPLSVNLETNELTVSTPAGEKVVAVLPDKAVQNMFAANVIDKVKGIPFTRAVGEAEEGATLEDVVDLITTKEGILAYEIAGVKDKKFLGFFKMAIKRTAVVSAETGEVLEVKQPFITRVLDLLSL